MKKTLITWAVSTGRGIRAANRSLHPVLGEVIGARLMRKLGIGAADPDAIHVVPKSESFYIGPGFILKSFRDGRLKFGVRGDFIVAIPRIAHTISLVALRKKHGIVPRCPQWQVLGRDLAESLAARILGNGQDDETALDPRIVDGISVEAVRDLLRDGPAASPDEPFLDFTLPAKLALIHEAIAADSYEMSSIHAARLFLACTTAHSRNVLVNAEGQLFSVDHEFCALTDGSEIDVLAQNVAPGTRAHRALCRVAALDAEDVRKLFEDLPSDVTWPIASKDATVEYFLERLGRWKKNFAAE